MHVVLVARFFHVPNPTNCNTTQSAKTYAQICVVDLVVVSFSKTRFDFSQTSREPFAFISFV